MFLEFQKITNSRPSQRSPIIVNSSAILKLDTDEFENHEGHGRYLATRVEVIGFPKYTFHTLTTMDDVLTHLFSVDVTSGLVPGNICAGGNTTGIVFPMAQYPFMKVSAIFNNTITETDSYAFNPNYLVYTEEVFFNDTTLRLHLRLQRRCLMTRCLQFFSQLLSTAQLAHDHI